MTPLCTYTSLVNTHAYPPLLSWPIFVWRVIISPWFFPSSLPVQRTGHCCTRGYRVIRIETYFSFFHLLRGSPLYSERVITKFMDNLLPAVFRQRNFHARTNGPAAYKIIVYDLCRFKTQFLSHHRSDTLDWSKYWNFKGSIISSSIHSRTNILRGTSSFTFRDNLKVQSAYSGYGKYGAWLQVCKSVDLSKQVHIIIAKKRI